LTYNVQLGFTSNQDPWDKNQIGGTAKQIHNISEIIRKVDPNIVLLQEIPKNRSNIEIKNFLETLADSLNMNYAFGAHGRNDPTDVVPVHGIWGNAILSNFPINNIENIKVYYEDQWRTRSVLKAEVKLNDDLTINVYSLHHNGKDTNEVKNTSKFVARSKFPVIVGGDFNRRYGNPKLNLLGLQDIFKNDIHGIDRIYCNINITLLKPEQFLVVT
jgi:endonuclease/exonuclease/phosphatase family metal-dependent hydrolase